MSHVSTCSEMITKSQLIHVPTFYKRTYSIFLSQFLCDVTNLYDAIVSSDPSTLLTTRLCPPCVCICRESYTYETYTQIFICTQRWCKTNPSGTGKTGSIVRVQDPYRSQTVPDPSSPEQGVYQIRPKRTRRRLLYQIKHLLERQYRQNH